MKNSTKNLMRKHLVFKGSSRKNRRGLSTVLTTTILLSAMAIMGVYLVTWSNTSLAIQQLEMENSFNEKMNKLNEDISIENIWFDTGPNIVNFTLNNIGIIGVNVTSVTIVNSTDTLVQSYADGGVLPGEDFSREITFNWSAGETTDFTFTTNRGNYYYQQEVT